jgi:hypothetical protein
MPIYEAVEMKLPDVKLESVLLVRACACGSGYYYDPKKCGNMSRGKLGT